MQNNGKGLRRHLPAEKKFEIVKGVMMGKVTVSEVCKSYEIGTGQYYKWQQLFLGSALEGLRHKRNGMETSKGQRLTAENERLKGVIAELVRENLQLKKSWGITGHIKENLLDKWGKTRQEGGKGYKDKPTKPDEIGIGTLCISRYWGCGVF